MGDDAEVDMGIEFVVAKAGSALTIKTYEAKTINWRLMLLALTVISYNEQMAGVIIPLTILLLMAWLPFCLGAVYKSGQKQVQTKRSKLRLGPGAYGLLPVVSITRNPK